VAEALQQLVRQNIVQALCIYSEVAKRLIIHAR